jgi:hypothetical protein
LSNLGHLTWIEDIHGNRLVLTYNPKGYLTKVDDLSGARTLSFKHYSSGLLTAISGPATADNPSGKWADFFYDEHQNLVEVKYADGSGYHYIYADSNDPHNITHIENSLHHRLNTWSYDKRDRGIKNAGRDGQHDRYTYVSNDLVEVTDA